MTPGQTVSQAIALISTVPGYARTALRLERTRIHFDAGLQDRGQVSLRGVITLGPEPFVGEPQSAMVSLSATLVHEHRHLCQNPLAKTVSFWTGVLTRTHPMRRFERPAYADQTAFLDALAASHAELSVLARGERDIVIRAFHLAYGAKTGDFSR